MAKKQIAVALQGYASHGAFTWGALTELLDTTNYEIKAICGCSSGAMNTVVMSYGLLTGGAEKAVELLKKFWDKIATLNLFTPFRSSALDYVFAEPGSMEYNPVYHFLEHLRHHFSPYQTNPLQVNPLEKILDEIVDFEVIRKNKKIKIFLSATDVMKSTLKVFETHEICAKAVAASACVPTIFPAVEHEGSYYWDGGYMGNPPLYPLIYNTKLDDILFIQVTNNEYDKVPMTISEIQDRINKISFNSATLREIKALNFVNQLADEGHGKDSLRHINLHTLELCKNVKMPSSAPINTSQEYLYYMYEQGKKESQAFFKENKI